MTTEEPEVSANAGSTEGIGGDSVQTDEQNTVGQNLQETTETSTDKVVESSEVNTPQINYEQKFQDTEKNYKELQREFTRVTQDRSSMRKEFQALQGAMSELQKTFSVANEKPPLSPEEFVKEIQTKGPGAVQALIEGQINPIKESYSKELESRDSRIVQLEAKMECMARRNSPDQYPDFAKLEPEIRALAEDASCPVDFSKPTGEVIDTLYNLVRSKHSSDAILEAERQGLKKAEANLVKESKSTVTGGGRSGGSATPDLNKVTDLNKLREIVSNMHGVADRD